MVLNNLPQMFSFYFPSNFWYDEVVQTWTPMVQRMRLPYESVADFMNDQVQGVVCPAMNLDCAIVIILPDVVNPSLNVLGNF